MQVTNGYPPKEVHHFVPASLCSQVLQWGHLTQAAVVWWTVSPLKVFLVAFAGAGHRGVHHPMSSLCREWDLLSASFWGSSSSPHAEMVYLTFAHMEFITGLPPSESNSYPFFQDAPFFSFAQSPLCQGEGREFTWSSPECGFWPVPPICFSVLGGVLQDDQGRG